MLAFSGGYLPINTNFVVGIKENKNRGDIALAGFLAIAKNLMFRGGNINPSPFLMSEIGEIKKEYKNYLTYNSDTSALRWETVIKGGEKLNPARQFYELLRKELPTKYFYFLPECPFSKIAPGRADIKDSAVDFYSPLFKLAIEIDGAQHRKAVSKAVDASRDRLLRRHNIVVIRIPSKDIYDGNVSGYLNKIKAVIAKTKYISGINHLDFVEKSYLYAFRFQIAVLEAVTNGLVNLESDVCNLDVLVHDDGIDALLFKHAFEDLRYMFYNLCVLNNDEPHFPAVNICVIRDSKHVSRQHLTIDISISAFYDQSINSVSDNYIYVRNDYFLYPDRGLVQDVARYKNYYNLYDSDFRFSNIDKENSRQHKALLYFLDLIFGFKTFRSNQESIICNGFNTNKAVIGILPTGAGKSICYQFVGMLTPGLSVVISPLKSLMEDQCANLYADYKISSATFINSSSPEIQKELYKSNKCKFVYIAPERFFNTEFKNDFMKRASLVSQIVVDEVHCLSEWGHDFRTSYLLLFNFLKQSGLSNDVFLMGTTATASLQVINDITVEFSKLNKIVVTEQSAMMARPELMFGVYNVKSAGDKSKIIANRVRKYLNDNEQTVVFVPTKPLLEKVKNSIIIGYDNVDDVATFSSDTQNQGEIIAKMQQGKIKTLVATTAFGMGLNIKHIRHTIHYCIGASVESIYQEMGRAGRDGGAADCYVCFQKDAQDSKLFREHKSNGGVFDFGSLNSDAELKQRLHLLKVSNFPPIVDSRLTFELYQILTETDGAISYEDVKKRLMPFIERSKELKGYWNPNISTGIVEKYLYKLYLLKLIDLWTVTYSNNVNNPTYGNVKIIDRENAEINAALETYIGLYEPGYKSNIQLSLPRDEFIKQAISLLCKWNFENFFMCRWRSLETLYDMLHNFNSSKTFSDRIEHYFSTNESLIAVAQYDGVDEYHLWFKVFRSGVSLEKLKYQLARYLESPSCVFGIKFISALVRLQLNDFDSIEGRPRLKNVLDYIVQSGKNDLFNNLMLYSLDFLPSNKDKLTLFRFLIENYKNLIMNKDFINKLSAIPKSSVLKERIVLMDMKDSLTELKNAMENLNA